MINELIKNKTPFAVIKYYEKFKGSDITNRKYEALTYCKSAKKHYIGTVLTKKETKYFLDNITSFELIKKNSDGAIYEYLEFKKHYKL